MWSWRTCNGFLIIIRDHSDGHLLEAETQRNMSNFWFKKWSQSLSNSSSGRLRECLIYMYIYYIQSLKCIWIKRFRLNENSAWTVIPNEATSHLGGFSFLSKCYCSSKDISIKKLPLFYIRTLQYWFEFKDMQDNTKPGIKKHDHMEQQRLIIILSSFELGLVEEFPL